MNIRKDSMDQAWSRMASPWIVKSNAMPGFQLRVWRTDGDHRPPDSYDLHILANNVFNKREVTNLRNSRGLFTTTYEITVETMPVVFEMPEMPEKAAGEALALSSNGTVQSKNADAPGPSTGHLQRP